MLFKRWPFLSALFVASLTACSNSGSPVSTALNVSGNYAGTLTDSLGGQGTISLSLSEDGSSLSGNINTTTTASGSAVSSNTFTGAVSGTSVTGTTIPTTAGGCSFTVIATAIDDGKTLNGSYASSGCSVTDTGTFTAAR